MNDQSSPPSLPLLDAFQNESSDSSSDYDRIDYIQSSGISIDTFDYAPSLRPSTLHEPTRFDNALAIGVLLIVVLVVVVFVRLLQAKRD